MFAGGYKFAADIVRQMFFFRVSHVVGLDAGF
jgi:hypothetical protein